MIQLNYKRLLKALRPHNDEAVPERELFEEYHARVGHLLPNWPDCPFREWLHRHYGDAVADYSWLRFDRMRFERVSWPKAQIYEQVGTHKLQMLEGQGQQIYTSRGAMRTPLQKMMADDGTWPAPIIVLDNPSGLAGPRDEVLGQPYHLLEGHLRLGYFRNIYRREPQKLRGSHDVWLVTIHSPI